MLLKVSMRFANTNLQTEVLSPNPVQHFHLFDDLFI